LFIALLGVMLVPLFVATWRTSLWGLAFQGLLMAWLAYRMQPHPTTPSQWLTLADLAVLRGIAAPYALHRVLRARKVPARHDLIPPNLLSWTFAFGSVLVASNFAQALVPAPETEQNLVAVAVAGIMLGFLVLATRSTMFSQMMGALRIENAIAFFELGGQHHAQLVAVQLGQMLVFVGTIVLYRWYLGSVDEACASLGDDVSEVTL
jgi:hydrogenase-4 membrane subunit HyfE